MTAAGTLHRRKSSVASEGHIQADPSRPSGGRFLGVLTALILLAQPAAAQERLFEVVATDKVSFNYPPPPREGRADYFAVAENGQARCVIVHPADAAERVQRAATFLATYLQLATGARFAVVADGGAVPEGLGMIHVGDTRLGLKTDLGLPDVRYGDEGLPNLSGYLIRTLDARSLLIRGRTEAATEFGVLGFLKR